MKKSLKNILTNAGIGTALTFFSLFNMNYAPAQNTEYQTVIEKGIVTFANKEEGEKAMKDYEERMKNFSSSLKTTSTELPSNISHPMYGLNYFVPAHSPDFATNKDFYGSGDVDGDGDIDLDDYNSPISGTDPFNDGTHRGDTDLDGVSGTAADKEIIGEYLNGTRTHINMWELETKAEQENHLEKALAIDPTDMVNPYTSNWLCYDYSDQTGFINFNGVYDINNSLFAENNGTNLQYDLSHNGIFRIPLRTLSTKTKNNVAHSINFVYISEIGNEDVKDLNKKIKIEPQTDEMFYENDNFSLNPNEYAKEHWYGHFNNFYEGWQHFSLPLCNYSLSNGIATLNYSNNNIVTSWNPFDDTGVEGKSVKYPADKNLENVSGIEDIVAEYIETEEPSDLLYYNETQVKKTSSSNRTTDGVGKYNYDINVLWELTAGKYNPTNTPSAGHNQLIKVRDTEPPIYNSTSKTWSDASGSPITVTTRGDTTNVSCDGLVGKANEYQKGTDVTGNSLETLIEEIDFDNRVMPTYVSSPADVEYIGNPNGANPLPSETGVPIWSHPTGNVEVHYTDETVRESYGEKDIARKFYGTSERSDCEMSTDTLQMIYIKSAVGIDEPTSSLENMVLMANPVGNDLRLVYLGDGTMKADADLYDLSGRIVQDNSPKDFPKGEIQNYNVSDLPEGMYLLRIQNQKTKMIYTIKVIIEN